MTQRASDDSLAKLVARKGDLPALEELYERHHARVYTLCLRLTGLSVPEAEELTHEVFIHMFRRAGDFRGESSFTTWLHRLTVDEVMTHFRRRGVCMQSSPDESAMLEHLLSGTANRVSLPVIDRHALDRAIAQLPVGYRTVFVLHDVEGYEHEEIARVVGIATGASKLQLHEARMRLRTLLRKQHLSELQQAGERNTSDALKISDGEMPS